MNNHQDYPQKSEVKPRHVFDMFTANLKLMTFGLNFLTENPSSQTFKILQCTDNSDSNIGMLIIKKYPALIVKYFDLLDKLDKLDESNPKQVPELLSHQHQDTNGQSFFTLLIERARVLVLEDIISAEKFFGLLERYHEQIIQNLTTEKFGKCYTDYYLLLCTILQENPDLDSNILALLRKIFAGPDVLSHIEYIGCIELLDQLAKAEKNHEQLKEILILETDCSEKVINAFIRNIGQYLYCDVDSLECDALKAILSNFVSSPLRKILDRQFESTEAAIIYISEQINAQIKKIEDYEKEWNCTIDITALDQLINLVRQQHGINSVNEEKLSKEELFQKGMILLLEGWRVIPLENQRRTCEGMMKISMHFDSQIAEADKVIAEKLEKELQPLIDKAEHEKYKNNEKIKSILEKVKKTSSYAEQKEIADNLKLVLNFYEEREKLLTFKEKLLANWDNSSAKEFNEQFESVIKYFDLLDQLNQSNPDQVSELLNHQDQETDKQAFFALLIEKGSDLVSKEIIPAETFLGLLERYHEQIIQNLTTEEFGKCYADYYLLLNAILQKNPDLASSTITLLGNIFTSPCCYITDECFDLLNDLAKEKKNHEQLKEILETDCSKITNNPFIRTIGQYLFADESDMLHDRPFLSSIVSNSISDFLKKIFHLPNQQTKRIEYVLEQINTQLKKIKEYKEEWSYIIDTTNALDMLNILELADAINGKEFQIDIDRVLKILNSLSQEKWREFCQAAMKVFTDLDSRIAEADKVVAKAEYKVLEERLKLLINKAKDGKYKEDELIKNQVIEINFWLNNPVTTSNNDLKKMTDNLELVLNFYEGREKLFAFKQKLLPEQQANLAGNLDWEEFNGYFKNIGFERSSDQNLIKTLIVKQTFLEDNYCYDVTGDFRKVFLPENVDAKIARLKEPAKPPLYSRKPKKDVDQTTSAATKLSATTKLAIGGWEPEIQAILKSLPSKKPFRAITFSAEQRQTIDKFLEMNIGTPIKVGFLFEAHGNWNFGVYLLLCGDDRMRKSVLLLLKEACLLAPEQAVTLLAQHMGPNSWSLGMLIIEYLSKEMVKEYLDILGTFPLAESLQNILRRRPDPWAEKLSNWSTKSNFNKSDSFSAAYFFMGMLKARFEEAFDQHPFCRWLVQYKHCQTINNYVDQLVGDWAPSSLQKRKERGYQAGQFFEYLQKEYSDGTLEPALILDSLCYRQGNGRYTPAMTIALCCDDTTVAGFVTFLSHILKQSNTPDSIIRLFSPSFNPQDFLELHSLGYILLMRNESIANQCLFLLGTAVQTLEQADTEQENVSKAREVLGSISYKQKDFRSLVTEYHPALAKKHSDLLQRLEALNPANIKKTIEENIVEINKSLETVNWIIEEEFQNKQYITSVFEDFEKLKKNFPQSFTESLFSFGGPVAISISNQELDTLLQKQSDKGAAICKQAIAVKKRLANVIINVAGRPKTIAQWKQIFVKFVEPLPSDVNFSDIKFDLAMKTNIETFLKQNTGIPAADKIRILSLSLSKINVNLCTFILRCEPSMASKVFAFLKEACKEKPKFVMDLLKKLMPIGYFPDEVIENYLDLLMELKNKGIEIDKLQKLVEYKSNTNAKSFKAMLDSKFKETESIHKHPFLLQMHAYDLVKKLEEIIYNYSKHPNKTTENANNLKTQISDLGKELVEAIDNEIFEATDISLLLRQQVYYHSTIAIEIVRYCDADTVKRLIKCLTKILTTDITLLQEYDSKGQTLGQFIVERGDASIFESFLHLFLTLLQKDSNLDLPWKILNLFRSQHWGKYFVIKDYPQLTIEYLNLLLALGKVGIEEKWLKELALPCRKLFFQQFGEQDYPTESKYATIFPPLSDQEKKQWDPKLQSNIEKILDEIDEKERKLDDISANSIIEVNEDIRKSLEELNKHLLSTDEDNYAFYQKAIAVEEKLNKIIDVAKAECEKLNERLKPLLNEAKDEKYKEEKLVKGELEQVKKVDQFPTVTISNYAKLKIIADNLELIFNFHEGQEKYKTVIDDLSEDKKFLKDQQILLAFENKFLLFNLNGKTTLSKREGNERILVIKESPHPGINIGCSIYSIRLSIDHEIAKLHAYVQQGRLEQEIQLLNKNLEILENSNFEDLKSAITIKIQKAEQQLLKIKASILLVNTEKNTQCINNSVTAAKKTLEEIELSEADKAKLFALSKKQPEPVATVANKVPTTLPDAAKQEPKQTHPRQPLPPPIRPAETEQLNSVEEQQLEPVSSEQPVPAGKAAAESTTLPAIKSESKQDESNSEVPVETVANPLNPTPPKELKKTSTPISTPVDEDQMSAESVVKQGEQTLEKLNVPKNLNATISEKTLDKAEKSAIVKVAAENPQQDPQPEEPVVPVAELTTPFIVNSVEEPKQPLLTSVSEKQAPVISVVEEQQPDPVSPEQPVVVAVSESTPTAADQMPLSAAAKLESGVEEEPKQPLPASVNENQEPVVSVVEEKATADQPTKVADDVATTAETEKAAAELFSKRTILVKNAQEDEKKYADLKTKIKLLVANFADEDTSKQSRSDYAEIILGEGEYETKCKEMNETHERYMLSIDRLQKKNTLFEKIIAADTQYKALAAAENEIVTKYESNPQSAEIKNFFENVTDIKALERARKELEKAVISKQESLIEKQRQISEDISDRIEELQQVKAEIEQLESKVEKLPADEKAACTKLNSSTEISQKIAAIDEKILAAQAVVKELNQIPLISSSAQPVIQQETLPLPAETLLAAVKKCASKMEAANQVAQFKTVAATVELDITIAIVSNAQEKLTTLAAENKDKNTEISEQQQELEALIESKNTLLANKQIAATEVKSLVKQFNTLNAEKLQPKIKQQTAFKQCHEITPVLDAIKQQLAKNTATTAKKPVEIPVTVATAIEIRNKKLTELNEEKARLAAAAKEMVVTLEKTVKQLKETFESLNSSSQSGNEKETAKAKASLQQQIKALSTEKERLLAKQKLLAATDVATKTEDLKEVLTACTETVQSVGVYKEVENAEEERNKLLEKKNEHLKKLKEEKTALETDTETLEELQINNKDTKFNDLLQVQKAAIQQLDEEIQSFEKSSTPLEQQSFIAKKLTSSLSTQTNSVAQKEEEPKAILEEFSQQLQKHTNGFQTVVEAAKQQSQLCVIEATFEDTVRQLKATSTGTFSESFLKTSREAHKSLTDLKKGKNVSDLIEQFQQAQKTFEKELQNQKLKRLVLQINKIYQFKTLPQPIFTESTVPEANSEIELLNHYRKSLIEKNNQHIEALEAAQENFLDSTLSPAKKTNLSTTIEKLKSYAALLQTPFTEDVFAKKQKQKAAEFGQGLYIHAVCERAKKLDEKRDEKIKNTHTRIDRLQLQKQEVEKTIAELRKLDEGNSNSVVQKQIKQCEKNVRKIKRNVKNVKRLIEKFENQSAFAEIPMISALNKIAKELKNFENKSNEIQEISSNAQDILDDSKELVLESELNKHFEENNSQKTPEFLQKWQELEKLQKEFKRRLLKEEIKNQQKIKDIDKKTVKITSFVDKAEQLVAPATLKATSGVAQALSRTVADAENEYKAKLDKLGSKLNKLLEENKSRKTPEFLQKWQELEKLQKEFKRRLLKEEIKNQQEIKDIDERIAKITPCIDKVEQLVAPATLKAASGVTQVLSRTVADAENEYKAKLDKLAMYQQQLLDKTQNILTKLEATKVSLEANLTYVEQQQAQHKVLRRASEDDNAYAERQRSQAKNQKRTIGLLKDNIIPIDSNIQIIKSCQSKLKTKITRESFSIELLEPLLQLGEINTLFNPPQGGVLWIMSEFPADMEAYRGQYIFANKELRYVKPEKIFEQNNESIDSINKISEVIVLDDELRLSTFIIRKRKEAANNDDEVTKIQMTANEMKGVIEENGNHVRPTPLTRVESVSKKIVNAYDNMDAMPLLGELLVDIQLKEELLTQMKGDAELTKHLTTILDALEISWSSYWFLSYFGYKNPWDVDVTEIEQAFAKCSLTQKEYLGKNMLLLIAAVKDSNGSKSSYAYLTDSLQPEKPESLKKTDKSAEQIARELKEKEEREKEEKEMKKLLDALFNNGTQCKELIANSSKLIDRIKETCQSNEDIYRNDKMKDKAKGVTFFKENESKKLKHDKMLEIRTSLKELAIKIIKIHDKLQPIVDKKNPDLKLENLRWYPEYLEIKVHNPNARNGYYNSSDDNNLSDDLSHKNCVILNDYCKDLFKNFNNLQIQYKKLESEFSTTSNSQEGSNHVPR